MSPCPCSSLGCREAQAYSVQSRKVCTCGSVWHRAYDDALLEMLDVAAGMGAG